MGEEINLLNQLELPVKEKKYSFDIVIPIRVLALMFTMVEVVN